MATAQPIAFTSSHDSGDAIITSGSYGGQNGSFNAASYTRRYLGSPISWRAGSFGSRFYPGVSPGQLIGPLDPNEFKFGKMSSSIESDRGSIVNALNEFERQDEHCRDYTCCGLNLTDLHALVDHFEECHVVVVDPYTALAQAAQTASTGGGQTQGSYIVDPNGTYHQGSFDPDDMELDMEHGSGPSSGAPSPPDTPISTPQSGYGSPGAYSQPASACASPHGTGISAFETTTVLPSRSGHHVGFATASRAAASNISAEAFNAYAGYSDYSSLMPGTVASRHGSEYDGNGTYVARSTCVPPALLHNSAGTTPESTPGSSRVASPVAGSSVFRTVAAGSTSNASTGGQTGRASTTLSRPATSLLLSKPFKCPKANCNKSYKQANGLKYHMTHGSCNFAPPKDLEQLQALLASKRSQKAEEGGEPMSDAELREVEKEAERRLRPYACGVGECQRRYKNMNGLRYHYQHSGDHGAIGLALLASGQHECLQNSKSRHSTPANSAVSSAAPSTTSSPLATPALSRAQAATNYTPASALPPTYQSVSMVPPSYTMQQDQYRHAVDPSAMQQVAAQYNMMSMS